MSKKTGIAEKTYILVNENAIRFLTKDEYIKHVEACREEELSPSHYSDTIDYTKCSKEKIVDLEGANRQFFAWMMGADYQGTVSHA